MLEQNGIHTFIGECGENPIFQQDGARCHTAVSTLRWFRDHGVRVLAGWPANSPDLSPVEQVWAIMKRFILQRFGMRTPLTLPQLEEAVFDAYNHIGWKTTAVLTLSAKYRVRVCLERNGKFIGDAVDECCRRASVEIETANDLVLLSVNAAFDEPAARVSSACDSVGSHQEKTLPGCLHCHLSVFEGLQASVFIDTCFECHCFV